MAWVRHHDRYEGAVVDTKASYEQPKIRLMLRLDARAVATTHVRQPVGVDHEALWLSALAKHLEGSRAGVPSQECRSSSNSSI